MSLSPRPPQLAPSTPRTLYAPVLQPGHNAEVRGATPRTRSHNLGQSISCGTLPAAAAPAPINANLLTTSAQAASISVPISAPSIGTSVLFGASSGSSHVILADDRKELSQPNYQGSPVIGPQAGAPLSTTIPKLLIDVGVDGGSKFAGEQSLTGLSARVARIQAKGPNATAKSSLPMARDVERGKSIAGSSGLERKLSPRIGRSGSIIIPNQPNTFQYAAAAQNKHAVEADVHLTSAAVLSDNRNLNETTQFESLLRLEDKVNEKISAMIYEDRTTSMSICKAIEESFAIKLAKFRIELKQEVNAMLGEGIASLRQEIASQHSQSGSISTNEATTEFFGDHLNPNIQNAWPGLCAFGADPLPQNMKIVGQMLDRQDAADTEASLVDAGSLHAMVKETANLSLCLAKALTKDRMLRNRVYNETANRLDHLENNLRTSSVGGSANSIGSTVFMGDAVTRPIIQRLQSAVAAQRKGDGLNEYDNGLGAIRSESSPSADRGDTSVSPRVATARGSRELPNPRFGQSNDIVDSPRMFKTRS